MLDPPSNALLKLLDELNLCSAHDLRRCRRGVRRLARDLPAFDSVWLDALVQIGRLTPFQQKLLESDAPRRLGAGPCVLIDRLGGGPLGETFLARPRSSSALCVLKLLRGAENLPQEGLGRIERLLESLKGWSHPALVAPHACDRLGTQVVLISRYVPGPHLGELLVRRGRFPARVVTEIARQLLDGLSGLEARGACHGDIRIANVRLTAGGAAVLVDAGVRTALEPEQTVHARLPPERYDGIAPELIGGGRQPNAASDLYALGCLLWQLLAGRPPYPGGDPLVKLAAHQTRQIDDVRKWAPDTPAALAELIRRFTARDPAARPPRVQEAQAALGPPRRASRRVLSGFRKRFDSAAGVGDLQGGGVLRWLFLLAALFATSGVAAGLAGRAPRELLLSIQAGVATQWRQYAAFRQPGRHDSPNAAANSSETGPTPAEMALPVPDAAGLILLNAPGPYLAEEISTVGPLVLRGRAGLKPTIVVRDRAMRVWAATIRLENVHFLTPSRTLNVLVRAESHHLMVTGCSFQTPSAATTANAPGDRGNAPEGPPALAWKTLEPRDPRGEDCTLVNSVFLGDGAALYLASAARRVECTNLLKLGGGPLIHLATGVGPGRTLNVQLAAVTCRQAGGLVRWRVPDGHDKPGEVLIEATDCVFDLAQNATPLLEFAGRSFRPDWPRSLKLTGEGSLARLGPVAVGWIDLTTGQERALDGTLAQIDGLLAAPFSFHGPATTNPADSEISTFDAPRRGSLPPGIRPGDLPTPP